MFIEYQLRAILALGHHARQTRRPQTVDRRGQALKTLWEVFSHTEEEYMHLKCHRNVIYSFF